MKTNAHPFINSVLLILCFLIIVSASIAQEHSISPADAQKYIGEKKTVCGMVASATYALEQKGNLLFSILTSHIPMRFLRS